MEARMPVQMTLNGDQLDLVGQIHFDNVCCWVSEFDKMLLQQLPSTLSINFKQIERADSSALALMTTWLRHARSSGIKIAYIDVPDYLLRVATLYGILNLLPTR